MDSQINDLNGIYQLQIPTPFPVGPVNVYLIKGDILTLVDTGPKTREAWGVFCELLDKVGYKPEDIEQVVLTHHHPDHVGLLEFMPKNIKVIGHYKNAPWISKDEIYMNQYQTFFKGFFKKLGIDEQLRQPILEEMKQTFDYSCDNRSLTAELKDGDDVPGLVGWKAYETPGHAGSHIILFRECDGLMIAGDLIIEHLSPNPFIEPPYDGEVERSKSLLLYQESLAKCLQLDMNLVLSGHGNNIESPHLLIHNQLKKQEERTERMYSWLREKPWSAYELSRKLFSAPRYKKQLGLTISVTVGHLDLLEQKQAIYVDKTDAIWSYVAR